jgi:hypothetical protein
LPTSVGKVGAGSKLQRARSQFIIQIKPESRTRKYRVSWQERPKIVANQEFPAEGKGLKLNKRNVQVAVRHLHLAFKGMETEEIYDVLMSQLIRAIAKYDPEYTEKVRQVVEAVDEKLSEFGQLRLVDVNRHVDFDCHRYLRLLCRRGYLTPAARQQRQNRPWGRAGFTPLRHRIHP